MRSTASGISTPLFAVGWPTKGSLARRVTGPPVMTIGPSGRGPASMGGNEVGMSIGGTTTFASTGTTTVLDVVVVVCVGGVVVGGAGWNTTSVTVSLGPAWMMSCARAVTTTAPT